MGLASRMDAIASTRYSLGDHIAVVGQTYAVSNYTNQHFTYSQGSSSSLGVGVSYSGGQYGTFTASGTSSKSTTVSLSYPTFGPMVWISRRRSEST
jgi:hypothetical protein